MAWVRFLVRELPHVTGEGKKKRKEGEREGGRKQRRRKEGRKKKCFMLMCKIESVSGFT